MKLSKEDTVWYCVFLASFCTAAYQLVEMANDWSNRPIETFEEVVSKTLVPFPSVTICPEGASVYPAMEAFLIGQNIDYLKFPVSVQSYMRIQLEVVRRQLIFPLQFKDRDVDNNLEQRCSLGTNILEKFCSFVPKVIRRAWLKVNQEDFPTEVLDHYVELDKTVHFFPPAIYENFPYNVKPEGKFLKHLWNLKTYTNTTSKYNQFLLYLYLNVVEVVRKKSNDNKANVMELFLDLLGKQEFDPPMERKLCHKEKYFGSASISKDDDSFDRSPLVSLKDMLNAGRAWNESLAGSFVSLKSTPWVGCNSTIYHDLYVVYIQLVYLQTFDIEENIASIVTQLQMYDARYDLPLKTIVDYTREINQKTAELTGGLVGQANVSWSLKDIVGMLTTQGFQTVKEKLFYSSSLKTAKYYSDRLSKTSNLSAISVKYDTQAYAKSKFFAQALFDFTSISDLDEKCLDSLDYFDPLSICKQITCREFCHKLKWLSDVPKNVFLQELLFNASQARMKRSAPYLTGLIPFCYIGNDISKVLNTFKSSTNFNFSGQNDLYNYNFCDVEQEIIFTDIGLCMAFHHPGPGYLFSSKSPEKSKYGKEWSNLFPLETIKHRFEDGYLLMLDSWAFNRLVGRTQDTAIGELPKDIVLGSEKMNNFKVILHERNEIPMFLNGESSTIELENPDSDHIISYFGAIGVEIYNADDNIRSYAVSTRKCRFDDEANDLELFKIYSEKNCLYECKLRAAKKKCGCVPWDFPRVEEDEYCSILGNLCFHQQLAWMKMHLNEIEGIGSPPCGCYPSCRNYKYKFTTDSKRSDTDQWLNAKSLSEVQQGIFEDEHMNLTWYNIYTSWFNNQQFLFKYVIDAFMGKASKLFPRHETLGHLSFYLNDDSTKNYAGKSDGLLDRTNNLAILQLDFESTTYFMRKKVRRVSFAEMVSAFGGTLGLFTGFTLISLVDMVIHARKLLSGFWTSKPDKKKQTPDKRRMNPGLVVTKARSIRKMGFVKKKWTLPKKGITKEPVEGK